MKDYNLPDHPEIACAMSTGYPCPIPKEHIECGDCSATLIGNDEVYEWPDAHRGLYAKPVALCEDCFVERVNSLCATEKANRLGVTHYNVTDHFEELKGATHHD